MSQVSSFFHVTTLIALSVGVCAGQSITEITLPGARVFPESITSTADGTLIVGSLGHGNILRIAPGKSTATEWIKAGTGGLNNVLGVYADEKNKLLWVCSNNFEHKGEANGRKELRFEDRDAQKHLPVARPGTALQ